jgi:Na+-transporting NADH:ubiquinone oxidoreductase subunit NqrB
MRPLTDRVRALARDPRHYQIAALTALLTYGVTVLGFDVRPANVLAFLAGAFGTQWLGSRLSNLPRTDLRSPWISALSLCLLLRTSSPWLALVAAIVAIGTKFVLRVNGKHLFNPTNIGIVAVILITDRAWVSPGQWGSVTYLAFLFVCIGGIVVNRAARSDVTIAFLVFYAAFVFGRSVQLGDPLVIPLHRLESGAILLFAFFMISDPKTTPSARTGRVLYAFLVAGAAAWGRFRLFEPNALLYALAIVSFLVPLIDRVFRGPHYEWTHRGLPERPTSTKGPRNENPSLLPLPGVAAPRACELG